MKMQQLVHKWNAKLYNDKHSFVYDYGESLIDLLDPKPNERILDLGCGSGELTQKIKERAGTVIGMDKSPDMIEQARLRFPKFDFLEGDASDFQFDEPFDAIFSNATLHWVSKHREAVRCLKNNLKKGGRVVVELGGKDNIKSITDQLQKSLLKRKYVRQSEIRLWYFPSVGEYTAALEAEGLDVSFAQWYERPTELADDETGIIDWLSIFGRPFFTGVEDSDVSDIMNEVQENLRPSLFRNGSWYADYKRIRVVAHN